MCTHTHACKYRVRVVRYHIYNTIDTRKPAGAFSPGPIANVASGHFAGSFLIIECTHIYEYIKPPPHPTESQSYVMIVIVIVYV